MYLKRGTFVGRLFSNWLLCSSGLLQGRVPWSVDGGDDLQPGRLQTLLQWLGGELIDQLAATWATSVGFALKMHLKQTLHTQSVMLLLFIFTPWIVLNISQHSYFYIITDCSLNAVDVNVNVHILLCLSLLWFFDAMIFETKTLHPHCLHRGQRILWSSQVMILGHIKQTSTLSQSFWDLNCHQKKAVKLWTNF